MFFFFVFHTHTPLLGWSRLKTPIVFPLLLLLLKYYVAIAFLFFSRPKKAMSLGKNWLFCFSYNLLTQELSVKKFYDQLRKYVFLATARTQRWFLKSPLGAKLKQGCINWKRFSHIDWIVSRSKFGAETRKKAMQVQFLANQHDAILSLSSAFDRSSPLRRPRYQPYSIRFSRLTPPLSLTADGHLCLVSMLQQL